MKLFCSVLVIFLLLQVFIEALPSDNAVDSLTSMKEEEDVAALYKNYHHPKINCKYACARRCRETSRKKVCNRACGTCCMRCHCVPAGTYGNTYSCPCYASLKTHGHKAKCP